MSITFQILSLHPSEEYNIHFPFVRGDLNIHKSLGGSISAVLADLETIWGHCISNVLNVPIKDLKVSVCVVVFVVVNVAVLDIVVVIFVLFTCYCFFGG